jgi:oxalate decarboxylase
MSKESSPVPTRRRFLEVSGAALAAAAMVPLANAQQEKPTRSADHTQPNEEQPGENNNALDAENPSSVWSPETDNGTVEPFKYSFSLAHKRIENGGWTRQVTARAEAEGSAVPRTFPGNAEFYAQTKLSSRPERSAVERSAVFS